MVRTHLGSWSWPPGSPSCWRLNSWAVNSSRFPSAHSSNARHYLFTGWRQTVRGDHIQLRHSTTIILISSHFDFYIVITKQFHLKIQVDAIEWLLTAGLWYEGDSKMTRPWFALSFSWVWFSFVIVIIIVSPTFSVPATHASTSVELWLRELIANHLCLFIYWMFASVCLSFHLFVFSIYSKLQK